jgi:primosomal protein N' (replication factor Y)
MSRRLARLADPPPEVVVLGPAEAPIAKLRNRYRFRLLVKTARHFDIQTWIRGWLARLPQNNGQLRITVDIDPYSFF